MRIIIVGAGAVGTHLAERLSFEGQDVVVIEIDPQRAAEIQERVDALVITGNGASAAVLNEAEVARSDLLIAVSSSDGANFLACHTAKKLGVKRTVARVQDPGLREGVEGLEVDIVIDPVESAAREIVALLGETGVSELIEFGGGQLALVGGTATDASPLVGVPLNSLRTEVNGFDWLATAIVRNGRTFAAHGDTTIREGDHLLLMVEHDHIDGAKSLIGIRQNKIRRVLILGTTRVASLTASMLADKGLDVVMIDPDPARCRQMAERHGSALIVTGDPTDPEVLGEFRIDSDDAVVALTGEDSTNLIGSLVAKALGASATISRVNRLSYVGLLAGIGVDTTVSVRLAAANSILRLVRRGKVISVATFDDTDAEAIEIEVDARSTAIGKTLQELPLPSGAVVGGILRKGEAFVPTGATDIRPEDHLIIFALPKAIERIEELFSA